jgi:hypothetical protein
MTGTPKPQLPPAPVSPEWVPLGELSACLGSPCENETRAAIQALLHGLDPDPEQAEQVVMAVLAALLSRSDPEAGQIRLRAFYRVGGPNQPKPNSTPKSASACGWGFFLIAGQPDHLQHVDVFLYPEG